MPVRKYKSTEEARRALWVDRSDPDLGKRLRRLWATSAHLARPEIPRGLRRFRSIEEADRERQSWIQRRVDSIRARRART